MNYRHDTQGPGLLRRVKTPIRQAFRLCHERVYSTDPPPTCGGKADPDQFA